MAEQFTAHITMYITAVDYSRYYTKEEAAKLGCTYQQYHKTFDVSGQVPEGAEESLIELALEEALAQAMATRQGD